MEIIFHRYGIVPASKRSIEVETIIETGKTRLDTAPDLETRDLLLIVECIKIDHYEIGAYEVTAAFAEQLGLIAEAELLAECLAERDSSAEILRKLQAEILKLAFPTEIPPEPIFKD
jgi:ferritin-like metal-binding protein YciE